MNKIFYHHISNVNFIFYKEKLIYINSFIFKYIFFHLKYYFRFSFEKIGLIPNIKTRKYLNSIRKLPESETIRGNPTLKKIIIKKKNLQLKLRVGRIGRIIPLFLTGKNSFEMSFIQKHDNESFLFFYIISLKVFLFEHVYDQLKLFTVT